VYGSLIYTVIYMSSLLLSRLNPNPHLPPPPELRSKQTAAEEVGGEGERLQGPGGGHRHAARGVLLPRDVLYVGKAGQSAQLNRFPNQPRTWISFSQDLIVRGAREKFGCVG